MPLLRDLFRERQRILADFGEFAIKSENLDDVLTHACRLVAEALGTHRAKVLELQDETRMLLVRAGVGWADDVVGKVRLPMSERSSETFAINAAAPVICRDIAREDRFEFPDFMKSANVVSLVNVPIFVPGQRPYGVLQVDSERPRDFDDDDIQFLRTYASILGPVIDRLHLLDARQHGEKERREHRRRLAAFFDHAPVGLSELTPDGCFVEVNDALCRILGRSRAELLSSNIVDVVHPEDLPKTYEIVSRALEADTPVAADKRFRRPDGQTVWASNTVIALRRDSPSDTRLLVVTADVSERRKLEDRQQVLIQELQHRTKNLLGFVRSVADMTVRSSDTLDQFSSTFRERLNALARVQALLSRLSDNERVHFDELIDGELHAVGASPDRITLKGPRGIALRSSTVQTLALALHELATNALKYGALSAPSGHLSISWSRVEARDGGKTRLDVDWRESGVMLGEIPDDSPRGQGRDLIERALPYQLGAHVDYRFEPEGLRCTISLPVSTRKE